MSLFKAFLDRANLKKIRYLLLSVTLISFTNFLAYSFGLASQDRQHELLLQYTVVLGFVAVMSSLFVQYLEGGDRGVRMLLSTSLIPLFLVLGCFLYLVYYPNISLFIKVASGFYYGILLYTLYLLNNVVLVVESREKNIPVYRVVINWVQIVLLSVSMPLFTSLFRMEVQPLIQVCLVIFVSFNLYNYYIWVYSNEKEIRLLKLYESISLTGIFSILVGWASFSILFFPGETFLRGVFISSVFLLGLGYIQLYLKNSLSKKFIRDYVLICGVFAGILVLFRP